MTLINSYFHCDYVEKMSTLHLCIGKQYMLQQHYAAAKEEVEKNKTQGAAVYSLHVRGTADGRNTAYIVSSMEDGQRKAEAESMETGEKYVVDNRAQVITDDTNRSISACYPLKAYYTYKEDQHVRCTEELDLANDVSKLHLLDGHVKATMGNDVLEYFKEHVQQVAMAENSLKNFTEMRNIPMKKKHKTLLKRHPTFCNFLCGVRYMEAKSLPVTVWKCEAK